MIKPIKTERDYLTALKRVEVGVAEKPRKGSDAFYELDAIATLVEAYERKHYAIDDVEDPIENIEFHMDRLGMNRSTLADLLGCSRGRVTEILGRQRTLTLPMIRTLHEVLSIPIAQLVTAYELDETA